MVVSDAAVIAIAESAGRIADAIRVRDEKHIVILNGDNQDLKDLVYNDILREDEAKQAWHDAGAMFRWLAKQLDQPS